MKGFLDTSVLVPVFYGDHVHHETSLALFLRFDKSTGSCGAHSLAEVFSTLTRMPGKHRISGAQVMLFVGSICERLSLVSLDGEEYAKALGAAAALGVVGGGSNFFGFSSYGTDSEIGADGGLVRAAHEISLEGRRRGIRGRQWRAMLAATAHGQNAQQTANDKKEPHARSSCPLLSSSQIPVDPGNFAVWPARHHLTRTPEPRGCSKSWATTVRSVRCPN